MAEGSVSGGVQATSRGRDALVGTSLDGNKPVRAVPGNGDTGNAMRALPALMPSALRVSTPPDTRAGDTKVDQ